MRTDDEARRAPLSPSMRRRPLRMPVAEVGCSMRWMRRPSYVPAGWKNPRSGCGTSSYASAVSMN